MGNEKQYTKGHFIELGLVIGMPLGVALGLALGNIAFGPLIGAVIGIAAGAILEKKLNKNPIELSEEAKAKKRKYYLITLTVGVIFFVGVLSIFLLNK
jgi:uncharacterized membrane protein YfcA